MDLTDIFRTFHPNTEEFTFFSSAHGTFSRTDHTLGYKPNLSKFKKIEIILSIFQIRKGMHQGFILSPCLFNLYAEYIMRNAGLEEIEAGIKIAGRNINNLRYADDTTLMAESEGELKSLLMKVKEESEKVA